MGLAGGLASGKSTAAKFFAEAGFNVLDADAVVAELYRAGAAGTGIVEQLFGERALRADGSADKRWLAERVFSDPNARRRLEAAIHPLVLARFRSLAESSAGVVVLEAAVLPEAAWNEELDGLVWVEAPETVRLERAVARGLDREDARARLRAQAEAIRIRSRADWIVDNSGSLPELLPRLHRVIAEIRARAAARPPRSEIAPRSNA